MAQVPPASAALFALFCAILRDTSLPERCWAERICRTLSDPPYRRSEGVGAWFVL